MKQIFCQTESEFKKVWEFLASKGYKHPNGGNLTGGLCLYALQLHIKCINIYPNNMKIKLAHKPQKNAIMAEDFLKSNYYTAN